MNKINNFEELRAERRVVEARISEHRDRIHEDFIQIKTELAPFLYLLPVLNIFKKNKDSGHPVLNAATSFGIDFVAGRTQLLKASWFLRLVVPRILKNITSKFFNRVRA